MSTTIHSISITGIDGKLLDLSQFKGKKILLVNTASECGFTPQYAELESLYQKYKDKLVVIGFPSNDFLGQEPAGNENIQSFCQKNYGVSFPLSQKIKVKGKDKAPIYQWLTEKSKNGVKSSRVLWNFQKYLVDEEGRLLDWFAPTTKPMSDKITDAIEN